MARKQPAQEPKASPKRGKTMGAVVPPKPKRSIVGSSGGRRVVAETNGAEWETTVSSSADFDRKQALGYAKSSLQACIQDRTDTRESVGTRDAAQGKQPARDIPDEGTGIRVGARIPYRANHVSDLATGLQWAKGVGASGFRADNIACGYAYGRYVQDREAKASANRSSYPAISIIATVGLVLLAIAGWLR